MLKLGQLLNDSMKEYINRTGTDQDDEVISSVEASTVEVFRQIKQFVGFSEDGDMPASPQLPPLSPPPFDPEIHSLEEKVELASKRIAKVRVEMQSTIQERLQKQILENVALAEKDHEADVQLPEASLKNVNVEELKEKLSSAAAKMPELRAKLEDVEAKLNRLVGSMDGEDEARAPNTVEKAVKGLHDEQNLDDPTEEIANPALKNALQAGMLSMRRDSKSAQQ